MDPHPMTKTIIDLGRSHRIRTLEIRITQSMFGRIGEGALGFSEIEVYR
jgi:hypothetical protein